MVDEEEIRLLEIARDESQPEDLRIERVRGGGGGGGGGDTESDIESIEGCAIFDSPSFTPSQTPSESESECSVEHTRMRKIQKTNDQLHKVCSFYHSFSCLVLWQLWLKKFDFGCYWTLAQ